MAEYFLETSALIELVLKDKSARAKVEASIPPNSQKVTSQYVIYEFSRGFFRYLIVLHNAAENFRGISDIFKYVGAVRRKAYLVGAILDATTKYFADGRLKGSFQVPKGMTSNEYDLLMFRSWLRRDIRRGWADIHKAVEMVHNQVRCRNPIEKPYLKDDNLYYQNLYKEKCGLASECGLRKYLGLHKPEFEKLILSLEATQGNDNETKNRIKALRKLLKGSKNFERDCCYQAGDAIISHEAPSASTVLTKNIKHIAPICNVFQKQVATF